MPIYRVNNTTYNIPDDMSVKFEQRFPNAKIDMYNGEEKYSIPVNEKNNFVKAYPKATFEYQGNDTSSQEQPSAPVQDFQPRQEVKDYALNNIPDMFKSKGNNLSTHPLQTQEDFSGGTSDSMKRRIEQAKRSANDQYMRQFAIEQVFKPKGEKLSTRPLQTQEDFFGETLDFMNRIATDENQRIEQAERAANDPYMRQQEIEHVFKPKNQEQINTVRNLIEEQNKRLDKRLSIHSGSGNNAFNALANSTRYNRETSDDRNQKAVLGYAEKLIEQAQNITDEAKRKGNTNFLAGFYRGFRDTPLDVWAMVLANLRDYAVANQVMDKVDKGKKLNPAEDALMQALVTNAATQMYYAGDLGRGYKAGGAIHESFPFMLEMLLGMGTIQAVTKPAAKSLLKYATEKAVKYGLGKATTGLAKGAARTISGLRDVAAHTATFGSQRVAADYLRRGLGDIQVKPNEDGTVSYDGRENIQTGGEALGKAIVSTAAETGSELLGEYFAPMLGWIGRATGANRIGKIIPASVGKAYSSLVNSQGFKQVQELARRAKIADPIGEYGEEVVNNLVSTAIGDMTPEQLVDLDQNIDTFLGVAPMSALFGAAGTAGYLRGQYRNYRNMRQFENRMQEEIGEDWSGVREALQDADIETAREMVKDVLSSDMTPQMKKDAITYISSVLQEQTLQSVDKQSMPDDIAQAKRDIFTNLSNTRRQIPLSDEQLDEVISRVESQGPTALTEMGFTPEQQDMIMSYNDAYQDYNNYTFWVQDMAQNARRQAEQQVESLTNATTGTVMRVKAGFSQEPVNILRGNVVFDGNGNVDAEKSDKVIYYLDKDGKVQMSPVTSIRSLIDETPAEEVAAQAGTDAENEVLQSEEAQVNPPIELGTVFSHNGQNYVVGRKTPDGYEIAAVDESGELIPEAGTQEVSEEDLRNAMNAGQSSDKSRPEGADDVGIAQEQPAITETQPESPVQGESSETSQEQEPQTALSRIPTNEKGEQDFESAPAEDTGAALMEISEGDIDDAKDTADQMILSYQEQLKKAEKIKTTGVRVQEIINKKAAIRQINDKIRYWQSVSDAIEKKRPGGIIAEAKKVSDENQQRLASMTPQEQSEAQSKVQENIDKGVYDRPSQKRAKTRYVKEDNELGQANTPMEHVLREIATGRVSFLWNDNGPTQGLGRHLGYSDSSAERKKLIWAFSNETGMTPEAASEAIHADMPENLQGMVTDQDIFNMIVAAFQIYGIPSKMWQAAKEMHGTDEIESMPGYRQDIERQALEWEAAENNMTVQEWIAYCDFIEEELDNMSSSVSDKELNTIFEQINDDYERRNETEGAGSTQGQADSEQGNTVQPERESDNEGRTGEVEEQPEPANKTDGESGSVVPEPEGTVDNNGYPFLKSSNETTIFGEIREETGLTPAPIKLSEGFNRKDEKGRNHGYGFKHIEESHGDQIRNYGFESIPEFVESVAKNYTIVRKGNKRNGIDTYILEVSDKKNNTLFVELSKDGSYWNVNSAGVFRKGYSKKKEVVWPLPAVEDASTAEDTGVQNAADSSNSMSGNSPQNASFVDKDTQSLEEKQEDKQKFTASEINQGEGVIEYAQRIAKEKEIWDESQKVDINPTEGQKEAGNYRKGHVKIDGFNVTIENPKGSVRSGKDADGNEWSVTMNNDYGYIRGTEGVDGDHIDVFLSDNPGQGNVYVIDQINQKTGKYDESKVMYGFNSLEEAKDAYLSNFEEGWKVGIVSGVTKEEFRKWIESSVRKTKPFSEYKSVNVEETQNEGNELTKERTEPKFLSESEYIERKTEEDFKNSGIEDRQEWDESDESLDSFNNASDEYPNYISNLSKSGELQRIYDQSSIGEKIKIRESVEAAGYEINELIDTSKEKSAAKEKRKRKMEARSKELMDKIGIKSDDVRFRETDVNYSDFAKNHNLNESDVKKYAQSMRNGNLGGASYAFKSIQRSIRLQNENLSLGQFVKVFSPIKKELYAKFGDIDSLREEYIQREIEERNMMEAAKKRIEEEAKAESQRLLEFENMSDQEMDEAYFKALENNDKSRMRDIVNESARRKGYMSTGEFRMSHRAPSYDEEGIDKSMIDVANNKDNIRDSLNEQMRMNQDKNRKESVNAINNALSSIEKDGKAMVTIYRAVPKSIKESNVRNGDWVTLSESYAKQHGNHALEGNYRIIKEEVPAENLYWDGNDINEWGYDDRNDYRYKDTKNNRKLNDLVTRDDNGNIIPPSKRFNSRKKDTRFRFIGEQGAANLDAAEEANTRLDNLAVAREMEKSGKDAKAIKMATGWERGADGKWRYETADFEYYPSGDARKDKLIENRQWYNEYMTLVEKLLDGETLTEKEQARYDEFYEQEQEARKQYESTDKIYLDDYIKDDELFNAYPELKRTKVLFVDKSNGEAGSYLKKDNTITININSEIEARSILAHEIQHAIQRMEGFATGGNYKSVLLFFKENPEVEIKFVVDETYKEAKNRGIDITKEELYKMFTESDDAAQGIENEIIDRNNITESELGEVYNSGVDAGYRAISGEVEARNVQSRLNMTPEERRNTLASETEDVAREDQIFLYDSMGANNMIIDTNQISEDIKREVEKTAESLHVPVEVITSTDQIKDESVRKAIESGRKIKGWYSLSDRKVYVYLPNTSSVEDAKQTILHEGVAHFGLRKLVGDENMDSFLDEIFANVTKEVREEIISTLPRYGWDSRVATEEYLASMAEQGADVTVWQRIIQAFKNLLRKIGIRMEINDKELRYILWRSRQNLESGNVLDMAKDIAMQYEMGVGNYYREVEQTPEQSTVDAWDKIASSTMFSLRESAVDYLTAVDKFQELISKRSGEEIKPFENAYDSMTFLSSKNRVEMDWFDSNIVTPMRKAILALVGKQKGRKWDWGKGELRRLVMYVEAKHGTERNRQMAVEKFIKEFRPESLKFFENAGISIERGKYDEELDSIKEKARKKAYEKSFRKIYDNLVKEGTQKEEAEKEAKKRADAIALIAESNASEKFWNDSRDKLMKEYTEKFMSEWNDIKKRISEKKDMSWIEKQKELDKEASRLGADLTQDYSGLSSVFGDENTYPKGWYEESMNFVDEYEKSHEKKDIDGLWKSISDATGYTLNKQYESGLVSKEYVETQKKRFENYIPLRGFQDEIAGDVYNYIGNDFYPGSNPVKSAGGRTSEPGNPFGSILNTGYSTISVGNKNLAKMSFFSLVNNHDTEGLAVAGRAWAVKYDRLLEDEELREVLVMPDLKKDEEIPEWVEAVPKYPDNSGYNTNDGSKSRTSPVTDMSSEDVARLLGKFEEVMKKNSKEGYAKPISKKSKIAYRTLYNERSEHEIPLFILGNKYVITITGNPRVAQAMNGLLNPNVNNKGWSEIGEKVQRFMAGAMTAKNAAFSIGNLSKDSIYANNQVFIKENTSYWLRFTKNQKGGFGDFIPMMIRLKNYRDGKLDMSDKSDVMFKEFMDNGGATGYTFVDTQEKYAKELADKLKELSRKTPGMIDPRKITKAFFDSVEFTGQAAELVNRFAAYRTSREMGRSVNRSIRDAKEITVNFNRKGAGMKSWNDNKSVFNPLNTAAFLSQYGRSYILFWNANMQAKYRFYRNIKEHPIKTTTTLIGNSMLFASILIPFMNNFALPALYEMFGCGSEDDDEDYYNVLTDFERTRNICVRLPHGNWLKIPLSPDMSPWFTMGDCIGGAITGQRELSASDFIKSGIDAISPLSINWSYEGSNIVLNVLPTIFQPVAQIAMNVNFMGNPIRKQPFTMRQGFAPKYTMVYGNTSPTLIELSRLSNRLTGGNDRKTSGSLDWNPADIQNLITGYTGGYGSSFLSAADWIVSTLKGEEQSTTVGKMPLVSRFFISGNKDVKVRRVNSSFYDVIRFTEEFKFDRKSLEDEIQNSLKEGNKEKAMQSRKDLEELLNSDRAKKFIELESIVEAAKDFDRYMKEIPEDENTKGIIYEIKMKGIERLKQK